MASDRSSCGRITVAMRRSRVRGDGRASGGSARTRWRPLLHKFNPVASVAISAMPPAGGFGGATPKAVELPGGPARVLEYRLRSAHPV